MTAAQDELLERYVRLKQANLFKLYLATGVSSALPVLILLGRPALILLRVTYASKTFPEPLKLVYRDFNIAAALGMVCLAVYWMLQAKAQLAKRTPHQERPLDISFLVGCEQFVKTAAVRLQTDRSIVIAQTTSRGDFASAGEGPNGATIRLSPRFAVLYSVQPEAARFVLAHEISHIAQNDTLLLARLDRVALFTRKLLFWYLIYELGFNVITTVSLGWMLKGYGTVGVDVYKEQVLFSCFQVLFLAFVFGLTKYTLAIIRAVRQSSEHLADLGASCAAQPKAFADWLVSLGGDSVTGLDSTHPSNTSRVQRLYKLASLIRGESVFTSDPLQSGPLLKQQIKIGPYISLVGVALVINGMLGAAIISQDGETTFSPAMACVMGAASLMRIFSFARRHKGEA